MKKYGNNKEENDILQNAKCREIVQEILNFGVNQEQIRTIIKLLSLELESRDMMLQINAALEEDEIVDKPTITV
jgi:hypothetical protein